MNPLSKSVAAKAVSFATPSKLSIPTQAASNVPRPSRIGPRVAAGARSKVSWREAAQADAKVGALVAVGSLSYEMRAAAESLRPRCNDVAMRRGGFRRGGRTPVRTYYVSLAPEPPSVSFACC